MARVLTVLTSAARTVSGTADIGGIPEQQPELLIYIDVTAVAGTGPSLTVTYQSSYNGTDFYNNTAGVAITAAGRQLIKVPNTSGSYGRLSYAIVDTITFSAVVEAK